MAMTPYEKAFSQLNPQQREAVECIEGPVLVLAGPGTGKTQILSTRIAYIVQQGQAEPQNILALTFTNAGAKNMQQRLVSLMGPDGYAVKCTTFHSFCADVIASHPDDFPARLDLADSVAEVDRYALVEKILKENDLPLLKPRGDALRNIRPILGLISDYKREGHTVLTLRQLAEAEKNLAESGVLKRAEAVSRKKVAEKNLQLIEVFAEYERLMREEGLYDYDDIILWVRDAFLRNEELLLSYQEKFQYVLIDEFQDTNQAQLQVAQSLLSYWGEGANVFAVGDPNQSIYRFQGASLANTLSFLHLYPHARVIALKTGYRCGQQIYDAAAELIARNTLALEDDRLQALFDPLSNALGAQAELFTHHADNTLSECLWIAGRIKEFIKKGTSPKEIAVLYRQHKHVRLLETILEKTNIPYEIDDGANVLDDPFVVQILRLLGFLVKLQSGGDAPDALPVLHQVWFQLDPTDVLKVVRAARTASTGRTAWDVINDAALLQSLDLKNPDALLSVRDRFTDWQHRDGQVPVGQLVEEILRESGIFQLSFSGELPLTNLNGLMSILREANEWSRLHPSGRLGEWLERLETMRRHGLSIAENELELQQESVRLSSAHKAKGQEWKHVFVLHSQDGFWGNRRKKNDLKALPGTVPFSELDENEHNEDERRLFYVALTRAKSSVTVCYSGKAAEGEKVRELQPTQFLTEMPQASWQMLPGLPGSAVQERLGQLFTREPQRKLGAELDHRWLRSILEQQFSLSPSSLHDFLECPAKFLFHRVVRLPQSPVPHLSAGIAAHSAMEFVHRQLKETGSVPQLPAIHRKVDEVIAAMPFPPDRRESLAAEAKSVVTGFFEAQEKWGPALEVEKNLGRIPPVVFEGLPLNGKIDRIDLLDAVQNTVRVVDYKDTKPKSRNALMGKTQEKNDYFRQLVFYALLAELDPSFPYAVSEGEIVFLRPKESGEYTSERFVILPEHLDELRSQLREVKNSLDTLSFLQRSPCGVCEACQHLGLEKSPLDDALSANEEA